MRISGTGVGSLLREKWRSGLSSTVGRMYGEVIGLIFDDANVSFYNRQLCKWSVCSDRTEMTPLHAVLPFRFPMRGVPSALFSNSFL